MIGSLLYLTRCRPDICFSVGVSATYQANLKVSHLSASKHIINFVNETINDGIWCTKDTNSSLARYSDADYVGNSDDRKSTIGGCFYLGNHFVSWHSKSISKSFYKFYSSNIYLLTYVANRRVKNYVILQKTLQIEMS